MTWILTNAVNFPQAMRSKTQSYQDGAEHWCHLRTPESTSPPPGEQFLGYNLMPPTQDWPSIECPHSSRMIAQSAREAPEERPKSAPSSAQRAPRARYRAPNPTAQGGATTPSLYMTFELFPHFQQFEQMCSRSHTPLFWSSAYPFSTFE